MPSRIQSIGLRLDRWFSNHSRVLPWRDDPSVYRVWVSEIMLQQTQVATVIPYFENFLKKFPTVEALASCSVDEVEKAWAGLGYYSRARNLRAAAIQIVKAGGFPSTRDAWLEVPGVGPYTAGAIASIALEKPEAILDGNVERVISRIDRVSRSQAGSDAAYKAKLWEKAGEWVRVAHQAGVGPRNFNQALMELGAMVCKPKGAICGACPVQTHCQAFSKSEVENFPEKKKKKQWLQVAEEVHAWIDRDQLLLRRRAQGEWRAGLWDFMDQAPSGKTYKKVASFQSKHVVTRHKITRKTTVWVSEKRAGNPLPKGLETIWIPLDEVQIDGPQKVATGSAFQKTIQAVLSAARGNSI
ncbi:MAG: A/G-specific adenine glycosylase [Bdellovibrionales bacterium]|nr:A/G-specific adenine glycosylase [Bdellovibrionales bacterium]